MRIKQLFALFVILTTLFTSCAHNPAIYLPVRRAGIDPELRQYVIKFAKVADRFGKLELSRLLVTKVQFEDTGDDNVLGTCEWDEYGLPLIKIDPTNWRQLNNTQRELLVFHELGHCYLGRDHKEDVIELDGINMNASAMYPSLGGWRTYHNFRQYYWYELFNDRAALIGGQQDCNGGYKKSGNKRN